MKLGVRDQPVGAGLNGFPACPGQESGAILLEAVPLRLKYYQ